MKNSIRVALHWFFGFAMFSTVAGAVVNLIRQYVGIDADPEIGRRIATFAIGYVLFRATRKRESG